MRRLAILFTCLMSYSSIFASSVTSAMKKYELAVLACAEDDNAFANFRRNSEIVKVYEHVNRNFGRQFYEDICSNHPHLSDFYPDFMKNDTIGNPLTYTFGGTVLFSPVTLRYIHFLGEIQDLFDLSKGCKIVEVGVGYGGQCSIISRCIDSSHYELVDLPYVLPLVNRYLNTLEIQNFEVCSPDECGAQGEYDLFISNYGISECMKDCQDSYIQQVIQHCKRGFILYNTIYKNAYSVNEFCERLRAFGIEPIVRQETIQTNFRSRKNVLIYWGSK